MLALLLSAALLATPSNLCPCAPPVVEKDEEVFEPFGGPMLINSSALDLEDMKNCVLVSCKYAGSTRYLVFPESARDQLYIDSDGNLLCTGSGSVVGQMLNQNLSLQYDTNYVTIYSIASTSFSSQLYSHGSYIQLTHYYQTYQSGSYRLINSSSYITLSDCEFVETQGTGYLSLIRDNLYIILFIGGVLCVFGIANGIGGSSRR